MLDKCSGISSESERTRNSLTYPVQLAASGRRASSTVGLLLMILVECARSNAAETTAEHPSHAVLGPGIYVSPKFPGACRSRSVFFPFVDAEYQDRWYTSASDVIGFYVHKDTTTEIGAALVWDPTERRVQDDTRLSALSDVKETARLKLFASRTIGFVTADANIATDILGHGQGTLIQSNLWATLPFRRSLLLSVGPGLTWADHTYMQTFYAVTPSQASRSPLPAFSAAAGISDVHLNGFFQMEIGSRCQIGISATLAYLKHDADHSPVTEIHSQSTIVGWVAYRLK